MRAVFDPGDKLFDQSFRNPLELWDAGVAELADARDLKSLVGNNIPVRPRSPALTPIRLYKVVGLWK